MSYSQWVRFYSWPSCSGTRSGSPTMTVP